MMNVPLSAAVLMLSTLLFGMMIDVHSECQRRRATGGGRSENVKPGLQSRLTTCITPGLKSRRHSPLHVC
jgi:hypothetical protein